jgi:hypothetical protein
MEGKHHTTPHPIEQAQHHNAAHHKMACLSPYGGYNNNKNSQHHHQGEKPRSTLASSAAFRASSFLAEGSTLTKPPADRFTNPSESYMSVSPRRRSANICVNSKREQRA